MQQCTWRCISYAHNNVTQPDVEFLSVDKHLATLAASKEGSYETLDSSIIACGGRKMFPAMALGYSGNPLRLPSPTVPLPRSEPPFLSLAARHCSSLNSAM